MEQILTETDTPYLPPEIITDILVRLPVKSLIRFQCVCKDWKNMFKTPSFMEEHLHNSTQHNPRHVVNCIQLNPLQVVDYEISEGTNNSRRSILVTRDMQVFEFQDLPITDSSEDSWRAFHYSNGLLCVERTIIDELYFYNSCWLWNPAIRDIRQVPKSHKSDDDGHFSIGFGFSPIVNDYKIVKLFTTPDHLVIHVEVYELMTGLWRKVELKNLEGVCVISDHGFTYNGSIFWIGFKEESDVDLIVSFDIVGEVFTLMPFPTSANVTYSKLSMYDNKLAILSRTPIGNDGSCLINLWVMEGCIDACKERCIWTKIYTSRPYPCRLRPMIIWRNEVVCTGELTENKWEVSHDIVLCNPTTNEFNRFAVQERTYIDQIFDYVESLFPVSNVHIEEP